MLMYWVILIPQETLHLVGRKVKTTYRWFATSKKSAKRLLRQTKTHSPENQQKTRSSQVWSSIPAKNGHQRDKKKEVKCKDTVNWQVLWQKRMVAWPTDWEWLSLSSCVIKFWISYIKECSIWSSLQEPLSTGQTSTTTYRPHADNAYPMENTRKNSERLGKCKSIDLPVFHAFSGSDITSFFNAKEKKIAWKTLQAYEDVTEVFAHIANHPFMPFDTDSEDFQIL